MNGTATHEEIRDLLRLKMIREVPPGGKVPSERSLQSIFNASRTTINKAITQLVSEGLLERRRGWGTFVCDKLASTLKIRMLYYLAGAGLNYYPGHICLLSNVESALRGKGHELLYSCNRPGEKTSGGLKEDGALFVGVTEAEAIEEKQQRGIPSVLIDHDDPTLNVDSVSIDNFGAGELAARSLLQEGHTRIAYIGHHHEYDASYEWPSSKERRAGMKSALKSADIAMPDEYDKTCFTCNQPVSELLSAQPRPSAVILFSEAMALPALHECSARGVDAGRDLSIITFGGSTPEFSPALNLPEGIALLEFDWQTMAEKAVSLLLERIKNPFRPVVRAKLELRLKDSKAILPPMD